jgi:hypothetical protein
MPLGDQALSESAADIAATCNQSSHRCQANIREPRERVSVPMQVEAESLGRGRTVWRSILAVRGAMVARYRDVTKMDRLRLAESYTTLDAGLVARSAHSVGHSDTSTQTAEAKSLSTPCWPGALHLSKTAKKPGFAASRANGVVMGRERA